MAPKVLQDDQDLAQWAKRLRGLLQINDEKQYPDPWISALRRRLQAGPPAERRRMVQEFKANGGTLRWVEPLMRREIGCGTQLWLAGCLPAAKFPCACLE
jgi:hypothetical protein